MKSLWSDQEAAQFTGDLGQRVYTSRLLGRDRSLVLHGGGNTSVKLRERDVFGAETEVLYVKGSGSDLEHIEAEGFTPVRLEPLRRLARLPALSDLRMVNELVTHQTRAAAPVPSVEAILHAILPHKYVDHTHADAIVTLTNTADGAARIREVFGIPGEGGCVVIVPYVMPGFDLARACAERYAAEAGPDTLGMVLLHHGIFTFGESAHQAYERMIDLVGRAESYLQRKGAWELKSNPRPAPRADALALAQLRHGASRVAGFPLVMTRDAGAAALQYACHPDLARISQQGPATPDHVIRTKRLPLLGRGVEGYAHAYQAYFEHHAAEASEPLRMLDAAPRVVIDPQWGICGLGRTAREAAIALEISAHTAQIILRAEALGGFRALPARDIFDVEYWELEQAKLKRGAKPAPFAGEVALVTGAASGIGKACVEAMLSEGAAVVALDRSDAVRQLHRRPDFLGIACDVTDARAVHAALEQGIDAFGGVDLVVLNAGIFPEASPIGSLEDGAWRQVMQVNLDANLALLRQLHPFLQLAPQGGRVVVVASKNVPAPGPGAAAYSASKAALTQLARVAALEWGKDHIRVNVLHPNAVFDTGLWTPEVLAARAASYGLSVEEYRRNNVLGVDVTSRDVARLAVALCGPAFACTTGAQVPVDGGNDRVI